MTERKIIQVPFQGFYESIWSHGFNQELEQAADEEGRGDPDPDIQDALLDAVNWRDVERAIAPDIIKSFVSACKDASLPISLEYESLTSPREYNFETDKLWAYISWGGCGLSLEPVRV